MGGNVSSEQDPVEPDVGLSASGELVFASLSELGSKLKAISAFNKALNGREDATPWLIDPATKVVKALTLAPDVAPMFSGSQVPGIASLWPSSVRSLSLAGCRGLSDSHLADTVTRLSTLDPPPRLSSLDLSHCSGVHAPGIRALASLPHLTSLALMSRNVRREDLCAIHDLPHLTSIAVPRCVHLDDASLAAIASPRLKALDISRCRKVSAIAIAAALNAMPLLKVLRASSTHLDDACIDDLVAQCPRIKTLDVSRCTDLTEQGFLALAACLRLVELDASRTAITDGALFELCTASRVLTDVSVDRCPHISPVAADTAAALARPNDRSIAVLTLESAVTGSPIRTGTTYAAPSSEPASGTSDTSDDDTSDLDPPPYTVVSPPAVSTSVPPPPPLIARPLPRPPGQENPYPLSPPPPYTPYEHNDFPAIDHLSSE